MAAIRVRLKLPTRFCHHTTQPDLLYLQPTRTRTAIRTYADENTHPSQSHPAHAPVNIFGKPTIDGGLNKPQLQAQEINVNVNVLSDKQHAGKQAGVGAAGVKRPALASKVSLACIHLFLYPHHPLPPSYIRLNTCHSHFLPTTFRHPNRHNLNPNLSSRRMRTCLPRSIRARARERGGTGRGRGGGGALFFVLIDILRACFRHYVH